MITQAVHGGGTSPTFTRRVYYIGTDTLVEGYALCYNFDSYDQSAEALSTHLNTGDYGVDDPSPARRIQVEKPSINNCVHFAGVVSEKSGGVTGPAWVEINLPGSVCNIYANASVDHGSTGVGMNTGQVLTFTAGQYYFKYTGLPGAGSAIVLQDTDRSTTAGLVQAELMSGTPSGGVQVIASTETAGVVSAGGALCIAPFGVTILDSTAMTTCIDFTAALTCCLMAADGGWVGQKKVFRATKSTTTAHWAITGSTTNLMNPSTLVVLTAASYTASMSAGTANVVDMTWNGASWQMALNSSAIVVA
jgi:hypothetical protein